MVFTCLQAEESEKKKNRKKNKFKKVTEKLCSRFANLTVTQTN